jgi:hypothetical protein
MKTGRRAWTIVVSACRQEGSVIFPSPCCLEVFQSVEISPQLTVQSNSSESFDGVKVRTFELSKETIPYRLEVLSCMCLLFAPLVYSIFIPRRRSRHRGIARSSQTPLATLVLHKLMHLHVHTHPELPAPPLNPSATVDRPYPDRQCQRFSTNPSEQPIRERATSPILRRQRESRCVVVRLDRPSRVQ